ncbi:6,7-dimethyl-8-ribityllumazine synthase [Halovulum dunhuangense]|uniref:6,7-dimethyl-8-ribityllumazine synthase n=1 Tax=Halovulum dunhuangense TaxID=1505036 RepID=A0A849L5T2_9RHOB|nr:6,7-dimethyl-8-ribityllumazine synthase [Halovulum dunhuangense]NNU81520.1 6,7-dimethyl-8-ribityllumazine synthase [Halovulum dunhuangense]
MATAVTHYSLPAPVFDTPTRVLIVVSPYYREIAAELLAGAKAACEAARAMYDVVEVPGALEIPQAVALAAAEGEYDGFVALGCVIRGETTHYDTVCNDSSRGLMELGLEGLCIGNGILTVENVEQAVVRAEAAGQNKGGGAAEAALHLIALGRRFAAQAAAGAE